MSNHHRATAEALRAVDAYVKLMRAAEFLTRRIYPQLATEGLTWSQFEVLEALNQFGPICQSTIAEKILKSSANVTTVIDNLEKQQLVRRERSAEDRRFITVHLTDKGRRLRSGLCPRYTAAIVEEMKTLTESEQEELSRLCRKLELKERGNEMRQR
jgi:MarR family 2-MHQ and catechol resistance regulon transcriptional repressor